jgi:hypothetical protein
MTTQTDRLDIIDGDHDFRVSFKNPKYIELLSVPEMT